MSKLWKLLALILALAMVFSLMAVLTGCSDEDEDYSDGDEEEEEDDKKKDDEDEDKKDEEDEDKKDEEDEDKKDPDEDEDDPKPTKPTEPEEPEDPDALYSGNGVNLYFLDMTHDGYGWELNFEAEYTGKKFTELWVKNMAFNSYRFDCSGYAEMEEPGTYKLQCYIYDSDLELCGVEEIYEIALLVQLSDEDWEIVDEEEITLEIAEGEQEHDHTGKELANESGITVLLEDYFFEDGVLCLYYYVENQSKEEMIVVVDELTVNGCQSSEYSSGYVKLRPGERAAQVVTAEWVSVIGITKEKQLESLGFTIRAYDNENYEYYVDRTVSFTLGEEEPVFEVPAGLVIYEKDGLKLTLTGMVENSYTMDILVFAEYAYDSGEVFLEMTEVNGKPIGYTSANCTITGEYPCLFLLSGWYEDLGIESAKEVKTISFELACYGNVRIEEAFVVELN